MHSFMSILDLVEFFTITLTTVLVYTGKPGDSLPVKRKPEKLFHLKRKVCTDVFVSSLVTVF